MRAPLRHRAKLGGAAFVVTHLLIILVWPVVPATARKRSGLHGCWKEVLTPKDKRKARKPEHLSLHRKQGRFRWQSRAHGRFMTRGAKIWMLDSNGRTGELWRYRFTKPSGQLVLHKPETFRYLGRGRYLYFQLRSPRTLRRFKRLGPPKRCPALVKRRPKKARVLQ